MAEHETNNTVIEGRDSSNPVVNLLIAFLVIVGAILLFNYMTDNNRTNTQNNTTNQTETQENTSTNAPVTTAPTLEATASTNVTQ